MNPRISIIFVFLLSALQAYSGDSAATWLVGQWKSNKDLTIATVRLANPLPPEKKVRFEDLFGKMLMTYTTSEVSSQMPPIEKYPAWSETGPYRVVAASSDSVVIRHKNPQTKKEETTVIRFESRDRYWVDLSSTAGLTGREYFDRVKGEKAEPNQAPEPTAPSGRGSS